MTEQLRPQRRARKIAMTPAERDRFLAEQRTCRVATVGRDGPHVTPLWFHWDGAALWLYSLTRSQRWADLAHDPRVSVSVDAGEEYFEFRGIELTGTAEQVGELPRTGRPDPAVDEIEKAFARKNFGVDALVHDGRHAWLRITPDKITSWDFRKLDRGEAWSPVGGRDQVPSAEDDALRER